MKHGFEITETRPDGSKSTYSVDGCASPKKARDLAYSFAMRSGWTEPRWWMWWRWGDTAGLPDDFEYVEQKTPEQAA